ncbi:HTTM domain-containing protein [Cytophaga hutchinsonii]|uniref:Gamma-glutamyl carboxylase-like protein n=1 Tax=Cytophaga hutchinsonii (strain ATCC 33406 / DSM 1761 / CIP 103989 / NBRC 15051 / NCIMB 9469 / D465) TaxID=269798 RepID=A0A6N4SNS3_CYTH3|nr:HTTM domain-containing protein [Cytophaga hutchinsonii]ABG57956.1 gamma-glutamyl carboxylase-like protein [Cytophaga hutchinsonii ATCC 33406]SFX09982.1 Vitamin K-dependent gamma-carboxylase [Cytophaga hutchinsonii ATCC 33406]
MCLIQSFSVTDYFRRSTSIAPLVVFRIVYGLIMTVSTIRFIANDWVHLFYGIPKFFFSYYGFEWVKPLNEHGMLIIYLLMALSFFMVMVGAWYRFFSVLSFLTFTYTELIDQTNYLNHYYFISLVALIMLFVPAHRACSVDTWRKPELYCSDIPVVFIHVIQLQVGIVYFYAGLAKINTDWLIHAMPLKIWLISRNDIPIIGAMFNHTLIPYFFSWFGMLYDLGIPFLLLTKKYRTIAYAAVIVFHVLTRIIFQIGMFPFVMIGATLIFFPASFHNKILVCLKQLFCVKSKPVDFINGYTFSNTGVNKLCMMLLIIYVTFQLLFPLRFLLYSDKLFWTEQGYRFSWRVMLMEKMGTCYFYVRNPVTGLQTEVDTREYLTPQQEKMMSTQPDMILQFAHYLGKLYKEKGVPYPEVRVVSYVAVNGRPSKRFIDARVDLMKETESFKEKTWILPSGLR